MLLSLALLAAAQPTPAQPAAAPAQPPLTLAVARATLVGRWRGKLEYRDYQADKWFGLPMTVEIRDGGDGVTQSRVADFDDGPKTGIVRITTVSILLADGEHESSVSFRKGKTPELSTADVYLFPVMPGEPPDGRAPSLTHWRIVSEETGTDDNRPAHIRVSTTLNGDSLFELKEVDFTDDAIESWRTRNRTTLTRIRD